MKEDYPLYVKWFETIDWIMNSVEKFPKSVRLTLSNRILNLSFDVLESIIEAVYSKQRKEKLDKINISLEKLRIMFRIANKRRYISEKQYEFISIAIDEAGKMTGGWKKSI